MNEKRVLEIAREVGLGKLHEVEVEHCLAFAAALEKEWFGEATATFHLNPTHARFGMEWHINTLPKEEDVLLYTKKDE